MLAVGVGRVGARMRKGIGDLVGVCVEGMARVVLETGRGVLTNSCRCLDVGDLGAGPMYLTKVRGVCVCVSVCSLGQTPFQPTSFCPLLLSLPCSLSLSCSLSLTHSLSATHAVLARRLDDGCCCCLLSNIQNLRRPMVRTRVHGDEGRGGKDKCVEKCTCSESSTCHFCEDGGKEGGEGAIMMRRWIQIDAIEELKSYVRLHVRYV